MSNIIPITSAIGTGPTELAAFDDALLKAGIGNHNLIYLSSIIPPRWTPEIQTIDLNNEKFGDRLYVVCAQERTDTPGKTVAAGLGWVLSADNPQRGLFVEHEGHSEEDVRAKIIDTLTDMKERRPDITWEEIQHHIVAGSNKNGCACALVAAVYKSETW